MNAISNDLGGATGGDADPVACLDAAALAGLAQLDPTGANQLVVRVLNTYLVSLARLRQQVVDGMQQHDVPALRLAVHTLKSSSASIGALDLAALCAAAEQAVRDDQQALPTAVLERLLAEAQRVDAAVRQLLNH
jgi:HPt (histidine-containing phosphotransfer) domain-containing protein